MAIGPILGGIGALVGGGSSLLSGLFGGKSSTSGLSDAIKQAGRYQYMSAQQAIDAQKQALQEARQYEQPFYSGGLAGFQQGLNMLGLGPQGMGYDATAALQRTPGYNWTMQQGVNALDRSAAASGMLGSGAQGKGLLDYGQNLALNKYYTPYMNQLGQYGQMGQNAASLMGGWGMNTAGNIGNLLMQQGQSQADVASQLGLANMLGQQQNWNRGMGGLGLISGTLSSPSFGNALGGLGKMFGGGGTASGPDWASALNTASLFGIY